KLLLERGQPPWPVIRYSARFCSLAESVTGWLRGVAAIIVSCLAVCFSVSSSVFPSSRKRFGRHETDRGDGRCRWGVVVDSRARGRSADGNRNPFRHARSAGRNHRNLGVG